MCKVRSRSARRCRIPNLVALLMAISTIGSHATAQSGVSSATAEMILVHGRVIAEDSVPVAFAVVLAADGSVVARGNERGEFRLRSVRGGVLRIRALGFRSTTVAADSVLTVSLSALPTMLSAMTTTVGAREIRSSESPRSVTIIGREQLDAAATVSANQALRNIPGLQEIGAPPSKTSISIRGFDDSRVLVLVDGEPVSGALIDSRDIGRLSTLATERIEVTKGPSSVEFGSDALGGVINLVQAAPSRGLSLDGQIRQGALGRLEGSAGASQTIGAIGYRVSGGWRQLDRLPAINGTGSTFNRVYDLRSDIRVRATDNLNLRISASGSQERQRWPVDQSFNGFIDNRGIQGFGEATYSGLGGTLRARLFEQQFTYKYRQSRGLLPIAGSGDSLEQREQQRRYLVAYTRAAGAHTFDAGYQFSGRSIVSPDKVTGDSVRDNVSEVFARDSWQLGSLLMTVGVRHSSSSLWGSATNPSLGAAWQVVPSLRLRANVARGFRAPGFKDIRYTFANPGAGYAVHGNPELIPERSLSSTAGFTWAPAVHLVVDAEVYRNDVREMIETRFMGVNQAGLLEYRAVNIGDARTAGAEANVRMSVGGVDIAVGYDWLNARDLVSAVPLSRRASHTARLQGSRLWDVLAGLTSDISVRYTGSAPLVGVTDDSETPAVVARQGAFLSADAQLRLALTRSTELSVGVNNLLDQRPALWTPAFDRQVYAGLRIRYSKD